MIRAGGIVWLNALLAGLFVVDVIVVLSLTLGGVLPFWGALITCSGFVLTGLLLWVILPRRFEVYDDRLVLVFGLWRWNISLDSIELARAASALQSYAYWGMRFSTSPGQAVEVRRLGSNMFTRPNLIISPEDRAVFLVELNAALARRRRLH